MMKPAIIVHGGAWDISKDEHQAHKNGCRLAAQTGYKILAGGGSALDAIETAVTIKLIAIYPAAFPLCQKSLNVHALGFCSVQPFVLR